MLLEIDASVRGPVSLTLEPSGYDVEPVATMLKPVAVTKEPVAIDMETSDYGYDERRIVSTLNIA